MGKTKWHQTPIYLLIALALALFAGMPFVPQAAASPDQKTFYSETSDGYLDKRDGDYLAVHDASSGTVCNYTAWLVVGQEGYDGSPIIKTFWLYRGALFFDTSSLPDDATISSAVLSLYGQTDASDVDFDITVVNGSGLSEPLVGTDYGYLLNQTASGGSFNTSAFNTSGYNDIPLNGTGVGWISRTGITKLGLRSSRDIAAKEPTYPSPSVELVCVYASEGGERVKPKLVVTYTAPVGGEAYPIDKTSVLALWIGLAVLLAGGIGWYTLRRHRAHS